MRLQRVQSNVCKHQSLNNISHHLQPPKRKMNAAYKFPGTEILASRPRFPTRKGGHTDTGTGAYWCRVHTQYVMYILHFKRTAKIRVYSLFSRKPHTNLSLAPIRSNLWFHPYVPHWHISTIVSCQRNSIPLYAVWALWIHSKTRASNLFFPFLCVCPVYVRMASAGYPIISCLIFFASTR